MSLCLVQRPVWRENALSTDSEPWMWSCHSHMPSGWPDSAPEPLDSLRNTSQAAQEQEASVRMEGAWEGAKGLLGHPRQGAAVAKIHDLFLRFRVNWPQTVQVLTQCCKMPGGF